MKIADPSAVLLPSIARIYLHFVAVHWFDLLPVGGELYIHGVVLKEIDGELSVFSRGILSILTLRLKEEE